LRFLDVPKSAAATATSTAAAPPNIHLRRAVINFYPLLDLAITQRDGAVGESRHRGSWLTTTTVLSCSLT